MFLRGGATKSHIPVPNQLTCGKFKQEVECKEQEMTVLVANSPQVKVFENWVFACHIKVVAAQVLENSTPDGARRL